MLGLYNLHLAEETICTKKALWEHDNVEDTLPALNNLVQGVMFVKFDVLQHGHLDSKQLVLWQAYRMDSLNLIATAGRYHASILITDPSGSLLVVIERLLGNFRNKFRHHKFRAQAVIRWLGMRRRELSGSRLSRSP